MARILVVFHTSEGQTARIAEHIATQLRAHGDEVDVSEAERSPSPAEYDAVVVGDSIHAVHHSHELTRYLKAHAAELNAKPSALFQVSLTSTNPDEEHTMAAQKLVHELLDRTGYEPDAVGLFAGALVYTQYGWLKRHVMRVIVKREGGDVDMSRDYEYTDWDAVDHFAKDFHAIVAGD
jgi:menaquinone-dependent protoporphyrinogen oxidase